MKRRSFLQSAVFASVGAVACSSEATTAPDPNSADGSIPDTPGSLLVTSEGDILAEPAAGHRFYVRSTQNAPTALWVENYDTGPKCQAEMRVSNGVGAGDFWISGTGYNDGSNFLPNEVGMVAESTAAGLHLRANGETHIRMSVGVGPREVMRITRGGISISNLSDEAPTVVPKGSAGTLFCENGSLKWRSANGTVTVLVP